MCVEPAAINLHTVCITSLSVMVLTSSRLLSTMVTESWFRFSWGGVGWGRGLFSCKSSWVLNCVREYYGVSTVPFIIYSYCPLVTYSITAINSPTHRLAPKPRLAHSSLQSQPPRGFSSIQNLILLGTITGEGFHQRDKQRTIHVSELFQLHKTYKSTFC